MSMIIENIKKLLTPYGCSNLKRYGANYDGGYVLLSNLLEASSSVYSYGVGDNIALISFDQHMTTLNKSVYMYDASIDGSWIIASLMRFKKENVDSNNIYKHIVENNHQDDHNMVLKMDIEGAEYDTLLNCNEIIFKHFNQIAIEVHDVLMFSDCKPYNETKHKQISLFNRLNQYYYLVHIHGNNNCLKMINGIADTLELLYIRKDKIENPEISKNKCPVYGLDFPNNPQREDINMNWWTYK